LDGGGLSLEGGVWVGEVIGGHGSGGHRRRCERSRWNPREAAVVEGEGGESFG
jgi:hypothetical protein